MFQILHLLHLRYRLRRIDSALDRLQARHVRVGPVAGMLAAERLQHQFEGMAVTRAILVHRLQRLADQRAGDRKRWQTNAVRAN